MIENKFLLLYNSYTIKYILYQTLNFPLNDKPG